MCEYYALNYCILCTCSLHLMQLLSTERANGNRDQLSLQETVSELQQSLRSEQQAAEGKVLMFLLCCNHLPGLLPVLIVRVSLRWREGAKVTIFLFPSSSQR